MTFLVLVLMEHVCYGVGSVAMRRHGGLLVHGLGGVMLRGGLCMFVNCPGSMLMHSLSCVVVCSLSDMLLSRLCHMMMPGRLRRHELVLLPL